MTNKRLGSNRRRRGGGPQHPFGSRVSPAPFPPAAPAPPVVSPAPALSAGGADLPNCPTCLEPLHPADPPRQRTAFWPGCRHPYHFACLARTVARLACSLCRAPWPDGAAPELIDACTALAVNPFLDSDAGSRPPTPRANAAHAAPAVPVDSSSGSDSDAPCPRSLFHNHFHGHAVARRSARSSELVALRAAPLGSCRRHAGGGSCRVARCHAY